MKQNSIKSFIAFLKASFGNSYYYHNNKRYKLKYSHIDTGIICGIFALYLICVLKQINYVWWYLIIPCHMFFGLYLIWKTSEWIEENGEENNKLDR